MQMMMLTSILSTDMRWRRAQVSRVGGKFDQLLRSTEIMDSLLTNDAYSVGVFFQWVAYVADPAEAAGVRGFGGSDVR